MTVCIGLGVATDVVRAVGVRGRQVLWAVEAPRSAAALSDDIVELLRHATLPRWPRAVVVAAVGPAAAQTKRLTGIPVVEDAEAMRALVREGTSRFFLRNGIPLVTAGVRIEESGAVWAAAFEVPAVREIEHACERLHLRIRLIVPSVVALTRAAEDGRIEWADGDARSEIIVVDQELKGIRRMSAATGTDSSPVNVRMNSALTSLGAEAWRFADAYGATQLPHGEPLALRSSAGELAAGVSRRSMRIAVACACVAVLAALLAPLTAIEVQAHRVAKNLAVVSPLARNAEMAERDLVRMSNALGEVADFAGSSRSPLTLLAQISRITGECVHSHSARGFSWRYAAVACATCRGRARGARQCEERRITDDHRACDKGNGRKSRARARDNPVRARRAGSRLAMTLRVSSRDRRTLTVGGGVVAALILLGRGLPALLMWERALRDTTSSELQALDRAMSSVQRAAMVQDSLKARGARLIALVPALVGGDSPATASATLAGIISGAAARSNVRIGALQLRADTASKGDFVRIGVRGEATGDIAGVTGMLATIEGGATLLAIREIEITQRELGAPGDKAEALHVDFTVEGLMLRTQPSHKP